MDNKILDKVAELIDQLADLTGWEVTLYEKDDGSGEVDGFFIGTQALTTAMVGDEFGEEEMALETRDPNATIH